MFPVETFDSCRNHKKVVELLKWKKIEKHNY